MKVTQIRAVVARTINLGNYESLRIEAEATADLDPGEDFKKAFPQLFSDVKAEVRKMLAREEVKSWRK